MLAFKLGVEENGKNLKLPAVMKCFAIPEVLSEGNCKAKCNYCNEGFVEKLSFIVHSILLRQIPFFPFHCGKIVIVSFIPIKRLFSIAGKEFKPERSRLKLIIMQCNSSAMNIKNCTLYVCTSSLSYYAWLHKFCYRKMYCTCTLPKVLSICTCTLLKHSHDFRWSTCTSQTQKYLYFSISTFNVLGPMSGY